MSRQPVAVLGATGLVGQHLIRLLEHHPWFELVEVRASEARAGSRYGDTVNWVVGPDPEPPPGARDLVLGEVSAPVTSRIVLSALPSDVAADVEPALAREGHLVSSNASAHRMVRGVPLVVPEVNGALAEEDGLAQPVGSGWLSGPTESARPLEASGPGRPDTSTQPSSTDTGALITNPNCVVAGLVLALAPIEREWGIEGGTVVTLQSLSGAGLSGCAAMDLTGNVIPWIADEEEKIEEEVAKILGRRIPLSVAVNRVPVLEGHTAHVMLRLRRPAELADVSRALAGFRGPDTTSRLPSLPDRPIAVTTSSQRPQPRLDASYAGGMGITVGRIRRLSEHDVGLVLVVHNAIRGAAGACLANAEWLSVRSARAPAPFVPAG